MAFFVVPLEGAGTDLDPRRPKYVPALGVDWAMVDHGEAAIVWANATPAQSASIGTHADALVVPPLGNAINVAATATALEAMNIPAQWLSAAMTYRVVLRIVIGMAQLLQRLDGRGQKLTLTPAVLDLTVAQIPAGTRANISDAINSLGLDTSGISGTTTVREVLRMIGQQFAAKRIVALGDL